VAGTRPPPTHHALIHHSEWEVTMSAGIPEFIPPAYVDPKQQPRRNVLHHTSGYP
jgi:hypothetical protein